ncbi:hypothetical protein LF63_0113810 [Oleiagrimonas soli]|uniref:Transporter n=1 Tax=Oleiagrimonas soli TaxID=1543381 RepID=A0A099CT50_9GAMM|nr:hypothetical protein LF63_0113810 [Oleiagrimonas soli]
MLGVAISLALAAGAQAQNTAPVNGMSTSEKDQAEVRTLLAQLQALKTGYADQVRRLRDLDAQVQALESRLAGRTLDNRTLPAPPATSQPQVAQSGGEPGSQPIRNAQGSTGEDARPSRSVEDVLQQEHALFDRKFTIENGLTYARYDRKQLTLNGFLALDAIFLGNIAVENVESDTLTYNFAARYGLSPRWTLNLDVPYLARRTTYQKGGAGGSAAATAEQIVSGSHIGDSTLSVNYRMLPETATRPDTVLTFGITAPTGRHPYGIDWRVLERDNDQFVRFAVPSQQPTGNGMWTANLGLSMVKTLDPAILFGNIGVAHSMARDFSDLDNNPDTMNPGRVQLGNVYSFGGGVAFAFNERTSLSLSFNDRINAKARVQPRGGEWDSVIGSDGHAATFNMGVTYALNQHTTLVSLLGIGLTPDAPDVTLSVKIPYTF